MRVFKQRPVYKKKRDAMGLIDRYKVRFTVAAYAKSMTKGIDYKEMYAANAHWSTYVLLLTFATTYDYDLTLLDVKTFFLYGELPESERIYMAQIPGREVKGQEDDVHLLLKSIYGHPAAGFHTQKKLSECLEASGFRRCVFDTCLYILEDESEDKIPTNRYWHQRRLRQGSGLPQEGV